MHENGAASTSSAALKIEIQNHDEVIELVFSPKRLMALWKRHSYESIVGARAIVVTPGVVFMDRAEIMRAEIRFETVSANKAKK